MSNTNITTTTETTTVVVEENIVRIELNNIGVQGVPGANNDPTYVTVRNATGATLPKGTIVYISGANGNHVQVTPALATSDATSARTIGWLSAAIANNASGLCMVEGYLEGVNTQSFNAGDQLYLSGTTAGGFTATKPVAPIHLVYVGVVTKKSAGDGHVFVKVQNGYELNEIHDVLITSPTNNQVLAYDSATQLWKNATNAPDGVTSITATAPLTGGTITSTGSIGLDQTALSITKSQVSDFTSGTVTSASTAQQAGTAVYAVNSGTAVYATTSGTAVYSVNSGTAVTISGSITKSQVSDFTSGTVTSASTAQQSGTAVYATNSGTAVFATTAGTSTTISGDITRSQVSDFASGTVAQAGTATYAVNSGTAIYANTSGTAVFATNASTAVSVSGSAITQSQVVNLVSDLAAKANLAGGNAFTGAQTITGGGTANMVQITSNVNTSFSLARFTSSNGTNFDFGKNDVNNQSGSVFFFTSQAIPMYFSTSGAQRLVIEANGNTTIGGNVGTSLGRFTLYNGAAATVAQIIRGAASQTADTLQVQDSSANVLGGFSATGRLLSGGSTTTAVGSLLLGAVNTVAQQLGVVARESTTVGAVIRGAASQTANLQEWQNSAGTVLGRVGADGSTFFASNNMSVSNGGVLRAVQSATINDFTSMREENSGGLLRLTKQTAAAANPASGQAKIYLRDGTNAGTLKLVVRAGAAGAETTILDNIPQ